MSEKTFTNYAEYQEEKEETRRDRIVFGFKLALCAGGLVVGGYMLGAVKGLEIGRFQGRQRGFLEGYQKATNDIANIVKDVKVSE